MNHPNKESVQTLSRRKFIKISGGITFLVAAGVLPGCNVQDPRELEKITAKLSAWVRLQSDGAITIFNPAAEMGQGSMTALAAIIAEEMDADWSDVRIEHSPIEPDIYGLTWDGKAGGPMITVGSRTVRGYYHNLRQAGAQARYVLMKGAADKWEVPVEEVHTEPGAVLHEASGERLSYGEIAAFLTPPEELPEIPEAQLKDPSQFRIIGKFIPRYDIPAKVDGSAQYSIDIHLPNMAYGVITRSPVNGAQPTLQNEAEIQAMEGILGVVTLDHGVGIIAETIEKALSTKPKLQIEWSQTKARSHNSDAAYSEYAQIVASNDIEGRKLVDKGNFNQGLQQSNRQYTIDFKNDYVYHGQMEPLNAVVSIAADGQSAEVWAGSQATDSARRAAAEALGLEFEQVTLHPCYLGGGFGRRSMSGYVTEAAVLAKMIDRPLKLLWTREDDVQYGAFRPTSLQRMQAGVDADGHITSWSHIIAGPGDNLLASGAETPYYTFPNQRVEVRAVEHGIRTKHWRSVGHGPNKYAIEAFIDEIAADLGRDPLEYRLQLMKDYPRAQKVLQTAADMANWGGSVPAGRARGIAFAERSGSLGAAVCEISVDEQSGQIKVHRFWSALDAGVVVQPDNAVAQMEGAIIMGISSVLKERISFKNGVVQQSNYHDYHLLRITEAPDSIEVRLIDSQEAPAGIGESGIPLVGGAIANAFAALTGKHLRHMPFTPEKVKTALNGMT
jgi:isoquinoline 1-oxidoreductase beta subunit